MTANAEKQWPEPESESESPSSAQTFVIGSSSGVRAVPPKTQRLVGVSFWVMIAVTVVSWAAAVALGEKPAAKEPRVATFAATAPAPPYEAPSAPDDAPVVAPLSVPVIEPVEPVGPAAPVKIAKKSKQRAFKAKTKAKTKMRDGAALFDALTKS